MIAARRAVLKGLRGKPISFTMPMKSEADNEMLEAVCENHGRSRERIAVTKAAQAVSVPAATLAR
jgi:hypothetical protein